MRLYPALKSILMKILDPATLPLCSFISGYRYLLIIISQLWPVQSVLTNMPF
jgi:hypothetical protein